MITEVETRLVEVEGETETGRWFSYSARVEAGEVKELDALSCYAPEHIKIYNTFLKEVLEAIRQTE